MLGAAFNGSRTQDSTASDIMYRVWNSAIFPFGGYDYYSNGTSTVRGTVKGSAVSVFINGKAAALLQDGVEEEETPYGLPSGAEVTGNAGGGEGRVTSGNTARVYCEGQLMAVVGSTVRTHANGSTTIADGSHNVYIG
jgi:hypothetical protein